MSSLIYNFGNVFLTKKFNLFLLLPIDLTFFIFSPVKLKIKLVCGLNKKEKFQNMVTFSDSMVKRIRMNEFNKLVKNGRETLEFSW